MPWIKKDENQFIFTKRISENLRPTPAGRRADAGRQNFERIPAAIRGRKKRFAKRIRKLMTGFSMLNEVEDGDGRGADGESDDDGGGGGDGGVEII